MLPERMMRTSWTVEVTNECLEQINEGRTLSAIINMRQTLVMTFAYERSSLVI